ncbi:FAD-dependent oxidoreductase [Streptomyces chisholmiae]|uniref:FAD-dependent oxidoreductase n=1 Tax=Streptomyces chisholmiae TaxID=3075540 RepID=UPI00374E0D36
MHVEIRADVAVLGGGLGGVSAALAVLQAGRRVVITESTRWLGGQLTSQLVPTDEHLFIEKDGANRSYRTFRDGLRRIYRDRFPLTDTARAAPHLNPGAAWVSPISADPRVAVALIDELLLPYVLSGHLTVLRETTPERVETEGDRVTGVRVVSADGTATDITAPYVLDATELGDVLALGGVEHVSGRESQAMTGEPSAAETADPTDMQCVTWCFAVDHLDGEDHTIDRPADYAHFRDWRPHQMDHKLMLGWEDGLDAEGRPRLVWRMTPNPDDDPSAVDPDHRNMGPTPDLWTYRRIAARQQFRPGFYRSDITVVNWPMNDYAGGALFGVPDAADHWRQAKALSRSVLYWLQTEAPRPDGGTGWPGLRLRADVAGTEDGFAMHPYIRESRRVLARQTITEQEVSLRVRGDRGAATYPDSVGVGHYFWIDRHASTVSGRHPGDRPQPFEIPLGALLPRRVRNLLPAAKNIGTTQITNGCYRLHPVEWSIGEAAGALAAFCLDRGTEPHAVPADAALLDDYQALLVRRGVQLHWPADLRWS